MARKYMQEELADIRALYPTTTVADLVGVLNERYGNNRTVSGITTIASKMGLKKKNEPFWTDDRKAFMREFVPGHSEREIADAFEGRFGIRLTRQQVKNGKSIAGVRSGTTGGRFEKGSAPWMKGKTWDETLTPEAQRRCREACFKPGNMPHNAINKPVGYERVNCDGYTFVKIADRPSRQDCNDNWRQKQQIEWEKAHGKPVPDDYMIVFANHDKGDFRPENLVAVPKGVWAVIARNAYPYHDAASLEACMNLARLKSCIYDASLAPRVCKRCTKKFRPRYPNQRTCDACLGREKLEGEKP